MSGELALDLRAVRLGQAVGEALRHAGVGELPQVAGRRLARRARSPAGTRSAARRARSCSVPASDHRVLEPLGLVERGEAPARAQVLPRRWARARSRTRRPAAPRRVAVERVLQRLPRAHVHQHVAGGDDRQAGEAARRARRVSTQLVVAGAVQQLEGDRGAVLEPGLQPHRVREHVLERSAGLTAPAAPGTRAGRPASARSAPCPRRRRGARGSVPLSARRRATVIQCERLP